MIHSHLTQHRRVVAAGTSLVAGLLVALLILRPRRFVVAGPSMLPTLEAGDRLLVARIGRPGAGDLVVLRDPASRSRLICKRVVSSDGRHVVVRGDNAEASTDSRAFGPVPVEQVLGRVIRRYWPSDEPQPQGARLRTSKARSDRRRT
ncbi:MAG: nickel-type superoxide dismutase maturation protease [Acidimicrobiales bacterium]